MPLLIICNPVAVYWCLVNPMETSLMLLFVAGLLGVADAFDRQPAWRPGHSLLLAAISLLVYLVRPEMIVLPAALGSVMILAKPHRIRNLSLFSVCGLILFGGAFLLIHWAGGSLLPGAASSRQICHKLLNTIAVPVVGWRINLDALAMGLLFVPFTGMLLCKMVKQKKVDRVVLAVLLSLVALTLFFTAVFCTTWRGRYLLPIYAAVIALAVPVWSAGSGLKRIGLLAGYVILLNMALLYPLARHLPGPTIRAAYDPEFEYYQPRPNETTALVQEVQGAYYYPGLQFISTDGLIEGSLIKAWKDDLTFRDYITRLRPSLVGELQNTLLADPDGLIRKINAATRNKESFQYAGYSFIYAGLMAGSGEVVRVAIAGGQLPMGME